MIVSVAVLLGVDVDNRQPGDPHIIPAGEIGVVVEAATETDAQLIACQMAALHCDMPLGSRILNIIEI